jgi:hypothetical protein
MILLLAACLERVTGEEVPLDPAFYAAHEGEHGEGGVGGGSSVPFSDVEGDKVTVSGVITSVITDLPVDIDVRVPDPASPGGVAGKGKILLDIPGAFSLSVPSGLGALELQAFQDIDSDGPSGNDPFASIWLQIEGEDITDVAMALEEGARGGGPVHGPAPPGAPGGGAGGGVGPGPGGNPDPFSGIEGRRVVLKGRLICDCTGGVDLDLFKPDATAPGGRAILGKMKMAPGPYELHVPEHFGPLILEGFVDVTGDGPSPGDAMGQYTGNPLNIGDQNIDNIDITLAVPADGMMPQGDPKPPPKPEEPRPGAPSGGGI